MDGSISPLGRTRDRGDRQGFFLVTTLGTMVVLTVLGSTILLHGMTQRQTGFRLHHQFAALQLADAALDQAIMNMRTLSVSSDDVTTATLSTGSFTIEQPPQLVGDQLYRVVAQGTSQQEQRRVEAIYRLTPQSMFQFALFGDSNINVSGSAFTDSYDSTHGPYNNDPNSPGYNLSHHGDIGTNSVITGGVTIGGSIFIDGQVAVGPEVSNPASVVSGYDPVFITGGTSPPTDTQDVVSQPTVFPMVSVSVPAGLTCSDYTVGGNTTATLAPGTYCYHNLTLQGGGTLTASGPVTVYLTGSLTAKGNSLIGVPADPKQVVILMTSSSGATLEEGTITGSTQFYGALYGPNATITITGNAKVFGSVVAKSVDVKGSA
ncbi:MAG: hypothetical protein HYZ91_01635, partial [Candidatus Omnitrophica bacterium]|nr:hypothetical protein [Candidatus Omnitrophota bacterium]